MLQNGCGRGCGTGGTKPLPPSQDLPKRLQDSSTSHQDLCRNIFKALQDFGVYFTGDPQKYPVCSGLVRVEASRGCIHVSLGHPVGANMEQIGTFSGFSQFFVQCTKISFRRGGMCTLFEICEKRPFQKCMGKGGIGDHIFEYRGRIFGVSGFSGLRLLRTRVRDTNS